jgi:hypothetical protein
MLVHHNRMMLQMLGYYSNGCQRTSYEVKIAAPHRHCSQAVADLTKTLLLSTAGLYENFAA